MSEIRGRVQGGRLLVDEPTDLPEGLVVSLMILDDADGAALDAAIEESYVEADRGELLDAREVLAAMRSRAK